MGLLVFTRPTNMKDLPSEIILLLEMKARGRTTRDQLTVIWCIPRIYNPFESKYDHSFKVTWAVKANILAPPPKHVSPNNIPYIYHSNYLRMHNP
jgi:hypothetical protein